MPDRPDWPDDDVLLMHVREAGEHRRAWALIAGLAKTVLVERQNRPQTWKVAKPVGKKPENWADRIHILEKKIVGQRRQLAVLEMCREWERETECILVEALQMIAEDAPFRGAAAMAKRTLAQYEERLGPRPSDAN